MINKNICFNNNLILYEKFNNLYLTNINNIYLKKLNISLIIPSNIKNSNGFVTMLILLEKNINNMPIFLFDYNTLSRNRVIKIGLTIVIYDEMMNYYLHLCLEYSIPKIVENHIIFNIPLKHVHFFYKYNKMLSNTIFNFDNKMFQYYIYLNHLSYSLEFIFYTTSKNKLINQLLIGVNNINITTQDNNIIDFLVTNAEISALEEEFENQFELEKEEEMSSETGKKFKEEYDNLLEEKFERESEEEIYNIFEFFLEELEEEE